MKFESFFAWFHDKPLVDSRLFPLLGNPGILRNQVNGWQKTGLLIRLKKGLYLFPQHYRQWPAPGVIASFLVSPSYLSLEYALSLHGLIPEAAFGFTCVTSRKTQRYSNPAGEFLFRHVLPELFWGYVKTDDGSFVATPEKALLDILYLNRVNPGDWAGYFREDLRLQKTASFSMKQLKEFAGRFPGRRIADAVKELGKIWKTL